MLLSLVVVLMLPGQAFAQSSNTQDAKALLNENSINQYEGQFDSYKDVSEYLGMEVKEAEFSPEDEVIVVSNLEELAAILANAKENANFYRLRTNDNLQAAGD